MKSKTKSFSNGSAKSVLPQNKKDTIVPTKTKNEIHSARHTTAQKMTDKKLKGYGKQNMQTSNVPSPQNNFNNKTYRPRLRNQSKLGLQNTVSLIINQSNHSAKKQQLLDSLLYGQIDLTYSCDLNHKQEESDQLLIESNDQNPTHNFKYCKNLSPIKSISEYSVNDNENQVFIIQKIDKSLANVVLKLKQDNKNISQGNKNSINCVLYRRLLLYFKQKKQGLLKFYISIRQAIVKQDLSFKLRQFLFQNAIIFNKTQLNQFIEQICRMLGQINKQTKQHEFSEQNMEVLMERLFLHKNKNNVSLTQNLWINEDLLEKLFEVKDIVSIWKLIVQLCSQAPKQIEASFRQSRFCVSLDSTIFIHETDEKRKQQVIVSIQNWLLNFLISADLHAKSTPINTQAQQTSYNEIKIKISPPP